MATSDPIKAAVDKSFNTLKTSFTAMKDKQEQAVISVLGGSDAFVRLPTGYGKTLIMAVLPGAFDVLCGSKGSIVLCVCPLISLMMDLRRRLCRMGLSADYLGSTQEDPMVIVAATAGKLQCVLATPETLLNNQVVRSMLMSKIYNDNLVAIIVDEAHCISKWSVMTCRTILMLYILCIANVDA